MAKRSSKRTRERRERHEADVGHAAVQAQDTLRRRHRDEVGHPGRQLESDARRRRSSRTRRLGQIGRDERPSCLRERHPPLGRELSIGCERGVAMHTERLRERPATRKLVAALQATTSNVVDDRARDLEEDRRAPLPRTSVELERKIPATLQCTLSKTTQHRSAQLERERDPARRLVLRQTTSWPQEKPAGHVVLARSKWWAPATPTSIVHNGPTRSNRWFGKRPLFFFDRGYLKGFSRLLASCDAAP